MPTRHLSLRPYSTQLHLYQSAHDLSLEWLANHSLPSDAVRRCDTCHIVHTLLEQNLTLAFVGDSIVRQVAVGLECDLRRRNYNVSVTTSRRELKDDRWRYHWSSTYHITVSSGQQSTTIRFFNMFRPDRPELRMLLQRYSVDIIVFDHGMHYLVPSESEDFTEDTLQEFALLPKKVPLIIWKETSTQHYNNTGGHYSWNTIEKQTSCAPIREAEIQSSLSTTNWMSELINKLNWTLLSTDHADFASIPYIDGKQEIVMAPFRDFTSSLWEMHPPFPDCTHFCSTPFLWLPIWRSIRMAMDRALRNGQFHRTEGNSTKGAMEPRVTVNETIQRQSIQ